MNGTHYPSEWENVTKDGSLQRIRVPNGWIVRSSSMFLVGSKEVYSSECAFKLEDVKNEWVLEK